MKRLLSHALVALLAAGGTALADKMFGGVVTSASARVSSGTFEVLSNTSIRFMVQGTGNYTDGGVATDANFKPTECVTSGANLAAAWSAATTTCVNLWKTSNGL